MAKEKHTQPVKVCPDFRPRLCARILEREGYDFLVLVDKEKPLWASVGEGSEDFVELANGVRTVEEISASVAKKYDANQSEVLSDALSFYEDLASAGFFTEVPQEETLPVDSLYLRLTDACNLSCRHCYLSAGPGRKDHMDTSLALRYIEELASMNQGGLVILSGGEPLLHPDFDKIVEAVGQRLTISLLTNGTLVTKETAKLFTGKDCQLQMSLDGSTPERNDAIRGQGCFEKVIRAIRIFQDHGLGDQLNISTVLQEGNSEDLENIARLAHELGVPTIRVVPMRMEGRAVSTYEDKESLPGLAEHIDWYNKAMFDLPKKYPGLQISSGIKGLLMNLSHIDHPMAWCPAGRRLTIDVDGSLTPCPLFQYQKHGMGNARETNLAQINADPRRAELIDLLVTGRRDRLVQCRDCPWKQFCQAGCAGIALIHYDTTEQVDGFCQYRKEMYEKLVFELSRSAEKFTGLPEHEEV